jgi:hypothetical protein
MTGAEACTHHFRLSACYREITGNRRVTEYVEVYISVLRDPYKVDEV